MADTAAGTWQSCTVPVGCSRVATAIGWATGFSVGTEWILLIIALHDFTGS
jgi:hypothetical protein